MEKGRWTRKQRNTFIAAVLLFPIIAGDIAIVIEGKLPILQAAIPFSLTFIIFLVVWFVTNRKNRELPHIEGDERSMKLEGRAFTYSWLFTLWGLIILMLNDTLSIIKIATSQCLFLLLAIMLVTNLLFRFALNKKGDLAE